jgi:hypothetical protein
MAENTHDQPPRRGRGRPFLPGVSANPGGRPRELREIRQLARERCVEALTVLVHLMRNGSQKIRLGAAAELLNRGYGKPDVAIALVADPENRPMPVFNFTMRGGPGQPSPDQDPVIESQRLLEATVTAECAADEDCVEVSGKPTGDIVLAAIAAPAVQSQPVMEIAAPAPPGEPEQAGGALLDLSRDSSGIWGAIESLPPELPRMHAEVDKLLRAQVFDRTSVQAIATALASARELVRRRYTHESKNERESGRPEAADALLEHLRQVLEVGQ